MHRTENFPLRRYIALLIVSALMLGLEYLGWARPIKRVLEWPVVPIRMWFVSLELGMEEIAAPLRYSFVGARRVADLERKIAELSVDAAGAQALSLENEELRKLIGSNAKPKMDLQPALVVGRGGEWIIAVGKRDGVAVGRVVVSSAGTLVGVVTHTDEFISRIQMLTDPDSEIDAQTEGGALGVVRGTNTGEVVFAKVEQKDALEMGMRVITRGSEGVPSGVVVGVVSEVRQIASEVYKSAVLTPLYQANEKYVFVGK